MTCIVRRPRCGAETESSIPDPLVQLGSIVGTISGLIAIGMKIPAVYEWLAGLGALSGGTLVGFAAGFAVFIVVAAFMLDRCLFPKGLRECVAGVVNGITQDFSSIVEDLFPFTAMHDRIDVVVKSRYWDVVENGNANVFCTDVEPPQRSEIMRCYFFTPRVCNAATGAMIGAGVGVVGGMLAAAAIAAAIGCATVFLCILALILAALIAIAAVLVGAFIGGQIGKAVSDNSSPVAAGGSTIAVGDLISVHGTMLRRDYDNGANVFWFVSTSAISGRVPSGTPSNPFSYCDIDDIFQMDTCPPLPVDID